MNRLLGMYVHTHWSYNHPYASRTWSLEQWKGYLRGLKGLGYNLVQIWPMLDTMPVPPTPSDVEHLEKLRQVIRYAHEELSMTVYVGISPNTSANEKAASFTYQDRTYFETEALVDPGDAAAMDKEMQRRKTLLEPLAEADGLWVLDCDPGGWKGSPVSEFVALLGRHRQILDEIGSGIRLIYWMWAGWTDKHDFSPEATSSVQPFWLEALEGLKKLDPEPWAIHACMLGHFKTIEQVDIWDRVHFYPYNLLEYEPSYPFTNWEPKRIADAFEKVTDYRCPMGVLGNSQTHCVQLPHAYAFAHIAQGGTLENIDPEGFGERLIPGSGDDLARAWRAMSIDNDHAAETRASAGKIKEMLHRERIDTGDLEGLFFGDVKRYLTDLVLQLELWANIIDLKLVEKTRDKVLPVLRATVDSLQKWNDRHGFPDRYHDVYYYAHVHPIYREGFAALGTGEADDVVDALDMFKGGQHGRTLEMLSKMRKAVEE